MAFWKPSKPCHVGICICICMFIDGPARGPKSCQTQNIILQQWKTKKLHIGTNTNNKNILDIRHYAPTFI